MIGAKQFLECAREGQCFKVTEYTEGDEIIHRIFIPARFVAIEVRQIGDIYRFKPRKDSRLANDIAKDYFKETVSLIYKDRNELLKKFCDDIFEDYEIKGSEKPYIISSGRIISAYVKNMRLMFFSRPKNGVKIAEINLGESYDKEKLKSLIKGAKHKRIFRLKYRGTPLYLSNIKATHPQFSKKGERLFFTETSVKKELENLNDNNIEIE